MFQPFGAAEADREDQCTHQPVQIHGDPYAKHAHAHQLAGNAGSEGQDGGDGNINGANQQYAQHAAGENHVDRTVLQNVHVTLGDIARNADADCNQKENQYRQQRNLTMLNQQRVQGLALGEAASVVAAPFWSTIAGKSDLEDKEKHTFLRTVFPSLLITGPFSIVLGFNGGLMALNDRLKLRSMVVGEKDDKVYIASEEAAIRTMEPNAENIWAPAGGEPVIIKMEEGVKL